MGDFLKHALRMEIRDWSEIKLRMITKPDTLAKQLHYIAICHLLSNYCLQFHGTSISAKVIYNLTHLSKLF